VHQTNSSRAAVSPGRGPLTDYLLSWEFLPGAAHQGRHLGEIGGGLLRGGDDAGGDAVRVGRRQLLQLPLRVLHLRVVRVRQGA